MNKSQSVVAAAMYKPWCEMRNEITFEFQLERAAETAQSADRMAAARTCWREVKNLHNVRKMNAIVSSSPFKINIVIRTDRTKKC